MFFCPLATWTFHYRPLTPTPVRPKTTKSRTKTVVSPDLSTLSFDSATDIRKYIYQEWKEKKMALTEEQLLQKRKKQKEEKDKLAQVITLQFQSLGMRRSDDDLVPLC